MKLTNLIKSKTLVFSLLAATFSFSLVACTQPYESLEPAEPVEEGPTEEELLLAALKAEYAKVSGKTYEIQQEWDLGTGIGLKVGDRFSFTDTKVIIGDKEYAINLDTDLEVCGRTVGGELADLCINLDGIVYRVTTSWVDEDYDSILISIYGAYANYEGHLVDPSSESSGSEASELEGTYSFNTAFGSQVAGSITLNSDLTWSYSGPKSTLTPTTYSVNGDKLTLNWSSNTYGNTYERTDTLTVEINGEEATLTSTDSTLSAFFSDFFGVATTTTLTLAFSAE